MAVVQATIKAALDALSVTAKAAPMTDSDYNNTLAGIIKDAILSVTITVSGTATGAVAGGPGVPITGTGTPL